MARNTYFTTRVSRDRGKFRWYVLDRIGSGLLGQGVEKTLTGARKAASRCRAELIATNPLLKISMKRQWIA